ncbi:MAG TPA: dTMP kinase [Candidatus Saccharimonadales bacterium]|nr:dTMP kinase [Candidatus Saccharimonadales bacterium]
MTRGKYIVLEGPEGVGKTTQVKLIAAALRSAGLPVRMLREPDSQSDLTARAIRHLTQDPNYPMNTRAEVLLYNAARAQSLDVIRKSVEQGVTCIVDRNYLTTLAIQYYGRGDVPDYETITSIIQFAVGDNEPDLTIVLDATVPKLIERAQARGKGERFDNLDPEFLERVRAGYLWEAKQRNLPVVFALNSAEEVFNEVWKIVTKTMGERTQKSLPEPVSIASVISQKQESIEEKSTNSLVEQDDQGRYTITKSGYELLNEVVTNTQGDVYAFTEKLSPVTIAAAMARLSRRGDDMRVTLLDEFAVGGGADAQLLKRIITAYGDDSVQQLAGQHMVIENASNLLTKKVEWGRLASYLEQSTRYIYFDKKDKNGKYRYFTPSYLNPKTKKLYQKTMDEIFDTYSSMVRTLTDYIRSKSDLPEKERDGAWKSATRAQACDAVRSVLPVATTSTIGVYASGQALEGLIAHLLSDELPEAHAVGRQMLKEARKVFSTFLERIDINERGVIAQIYRAETYQKVKAIANKDLPQTYTSEQQEVTLSSYWPRNELDLVPDMLYEHSHLSLEEIQKSVETWTYEKREEVLRAYMGERFNRRHKPGRALEKAHYSWDLMCDYGIFRDLQRHRMVDDLEWQQLTPRYGYDIPELIEEADLADQFEKCFDLSLKLFSELQRSDYGMEAQYATLLGHRMRWKVTYNAREAFHLHELRTTPQGHPGYRKLVQQMHDKLREVHPLLAEAMKFVNKDEDPELTRLAAERYTQFKLEQLK